MYLNPKYSQGDGSEFEWENCGCAVVTDLIDAATVGALRIPAWKVRNASGDTSGGLTDSQLVDVAWKLTKDTKWPVLLVQRAVYRSQVDDIIEAGKRFGGSITTAVTNPTRFRTGSGTAIFGHKIYSADHEPGYYYNEDPGTTAAGYEWWPADLYYDAMEARSGTGKCLLIVAPDTEDVDIVAVDRGRIFSRPDRSATVVGTFAAGHRFHATKTVNGGMWARADGGQSNGWWKIGAGRYIPGKKARRA